jgi:hypothetical protein
LNIVFWNIDKNNLDDELELMAANISPDILFLAECKMSIAKILATLNKNKTQYFYNEDPVCEKIKMFSKFRDKFVRPTKSSLRYTVRRIRIPSYPDFNLMCLHYQSKVNWDFSDQAAHSVEIRTIITDFEKKNNSTNTVVIGDFNMNPFDFGMVQTTGLHAVMSKDIALKISRTVDGNDYPFFYNPMWSFFGEEGKGDVHGTIYNTLSKPINYFWNIFDQVLIRPSMIKFVDDREITILTEIGVKKQLLKKTDLIDDSISDHLPISITIKNL